MSAVRIAIAIAAAAVAAAVLAGAAPAATSNKLYAFMDGEAETRDGDTDGHARIAITFNRGEGRVCFDLRKFKLETAAMAHIHSGRKGKDGPIVVTLFGKPTGAGRGKVTGCADDIPRTTMNRILARPSAFYANVHTARYPSGSVRGQLTTRKLV